MIASKMTILNFGADKQSVINAINGFKFTELTGYTVQTAGFVPPKIDSDNAVVMDELVVFRLRIDQKKVPGSAVKSELAKKVAKYEQENGHKPGRKEKKQMKEDVADMLVAKAIAQESYIDGWFDFNDKLLVLTDNSTSKIDLFVGIIAKNCQNLSLQPVTTNLSPSDVLTNWVSSGSHPDWLTLDDKAKLEFPNGGKASLSSLNITDERITNLMSMDAKVVELAVTVQDRLCVVVSDKLHFKKVGYVELDTSDVQEEDMFQTFSFLNAETARELRNKFTEALGGEAA